MATDYITHQSDAQLRKLIERKRRQSIISNRSSNSANKKLLPRRLKFVRPTNPQNSKPKNMSSNSSSPSLVGRQSSAFNAPPRHLFPEEEVLKMMEWKRNRPVGGGLRNLGNSCFMNATLQCLCYTAPFQHFLMKRIHPKKCRISGFCLFCEFQTLLPTMLDTSSAVMPQTVFRNLRLISKLLRPGRQEDAHEFLRMLMDNLQTSALKSEPKKIKNSRIEETTVIHKIWGGYLRSQVKCSKCGNESNSYEAILDLSLEIRGSNVESCLKHFTETEQLCGDNKYRCDNCKKLRNATKQFTVFEPPNCLVLHLKRFEYGGFSGKINKHVRFTETLDISPVMAYQTCPKVTYSLAGVLVHCGYSAHSGHYYSYIKAPNQSWYCMDDSSVSPSSLSTVLSQKAYILFYTRNEPKVAYRSPALTPLKGFEALSLSNSKTLMSIMNENRSKDTHSNSVTPTSSRNGSASSIIVRPKLANLKRKIKRGDSIATTMKTSGFSGSSSSTSSNDSLSRFSNTGKRIIDNNNNNTSSSLPPPPTKKPSHRTTLSKDSKLERRIGGKKRSKNEVMTSDVTNTTEQPSTDSICKRRKLNPGMTPEALSFLETRFDDMVTTETELIRKPTKSNKPIVSSPLQRQTVPHTTVSSPVKSKKQKTKAVSAKATAAVVNTSVGSSPPNLFAVPSWTADNESESSTTTATDDSQSPSSRHSNSLSSIDDDSPLLQSAKQHYQIPTHASAMAKKRIVGKFLRDEDPIHQATHGLSVGHWTNDSGMAPSNIRLREQIVSRFQSQSLLAPKDEWENMIDTGTAYPKNTKKKKPKTVWDRQDRRKRKGEATNLFQSRQHKASHPKRDTPASKIPLTNTSNHWRQTQQRKRGQQRNSHYRMNRMVPQS